MDPKNQFNYRSPESPVADWSEVAHDRATRAYYANDDPEHPMPRAAHRWGPPQLIRHKSTE